MKKFWCIALALLVSGSALAAGENARYKVTTGSKTGTYFRVGLNLTGIVSGGHVLSSKGSVQNLDRLASGEADIAIVQLDALAWYANKKPAEAANIEVLGPLYKECAYMAVNCKGKIGDEDDIKKGVTIAAGKKGSGSAVSWDYMRQLNTAYKDAAVVFQGGPRALGKLASSPDSGVDGVLWVIKPDISKNKSLKTVMKNDNLCMIDLDDYSLNNEFKPLGKPIYEFMKIDIAKGLFNDKEITVPCVDAVLVARSDIDEELLDEVADTVLNYKASLVK